MSETQTEHTPHPGSRIDATAQAALAETPGPIAETGPEESARIDAVPTADQAADTGNYYTRALAANGGLSLILPQDLRRRAARVWTSTASAIVLTNSLDIAQQAVTLAAAGSAPLATLPQNVVVPITHRDLVYAVNIGGAPASVNIAVERDF